MYKLGRSLQQATLSMPLRGVSWAEHSSPDKHLAESSRITRDLIREWRWGSGRQFAELAAPGTTASDVIAGPRAYASVLVVTTSGATPSRRGVEEPFFGIEHSAAADEHAADLESLLPVAAINSGAGLLEAALARRLFPLRVTVAPFQHVNATTWGPFAVYDVSSGLITLDVRVLEAMQQLPDAAISGLARIATSTFAQLASYASSEISNGKDTTQTVADVWANVSKAATMALTAALASQIPLWWCLACPIVLGMLAPFLFNFGLGALADLVCTRYQLPSDECNDLWYGVFALGMVLSLASAVPIVYICRLPECGKKIWAR
ncbi:hypothetical protein WJX72_000045 [[Myrmecia] bisecta]|uniref:Uncharacterized protein n=1 Tax=[Myrmecia] bisecta TaxID=41462 RepID=A0AAW1Q0K6_9CHLO